LEHSKFTPLAKGPATPRMASDLTVAAALAQAALTGALANVEINLEDLKDAAFVGEVRSRAAAPQR